jgi:hypothetical protein
LVEIKHGSGNNGAGVVHADELAFEEMRLLAWEFGVGEELGGGDAGEDVLDFTRDAELGGCNGWELLPLLV